MHGVFIMFITLIRLYCSATLMLYTVKKAKSEEHLFAQFPHPTRRDACAVYEYILCIGRILYCGLYLCTCVLVWLVACSSPPAEGKNE